MLSKIYIILAEVKKKHVETPLMKQYYAIKGKYPTALLLFRVGDFYETFGDDAIKASGILGITLTKRANGAASFVELAGFPHHALDTYLPKLVRAGERVAICDQLEDPKKTKKIVKRGVTELVTPGVSYNDKILNHKSNNFLASVHLDKNYAGISFLDISTGEFLVAEGTHDYIDKLLSGFRPSEVIVQRNKLKEFHKIFGEKHYTSTLDEWVFVSDFSEDLLLKHFETKTLKGYGISNLPHGIIAAGASLHYLAETQHDKIQHITSISRIEEDKYVWLDRFTIRNLELFSSENSDAITLSDVLDNTVSPMGARLLKRWIALPVKDLAPINERLNIVDYIKNNDEFKELLSQQIKQIGDLERLISKVAVSRVSPRELVQIKRALFAIEPIKEACYNSSIDEVKKIGEQLNPCKIIRDKIEKEIVDEPPIAINKGNVIADGISEELDELRKIAFSGKDYLVDLQKRESEKTGISSLKIGFNNVFGYYLEVRNTHKDKVPESWIRKQTLTSGERYITEELKSYEEKILGAEEKISSLEFELYNKLVFDIFEYIKPIQLNSALIAKLDCLTSFANNAIRYDYVRPEINEGYELDIKNGRHPVIEQNLPIGESYIANDIFLDNKTQQEIMITGPNMSGKSALLRQTALIVLLAQMGSFVPADSAKIGLVDKIFTRVGASDNISSGESTFMVEMNETASILNNLSDRSLVLLDEIGRGTSTYDGISIAWAIAEYIHENPNAKAKTLFATHYHELNEMTNTFKRIKNYNVSVKEVGSKVIFIRKLVKGGSEHSFGIHVAKMAGMPKSVVKRANEILKEMEGDRATVGSSDLKRPIEEIKTHKEGYQLSFVQLNDPLLEDIKTRIENLDVNNLTPVEALNTLDKIKSLLKA